VRHYAAGAPIEAGKPLTLIAGQSAKSTLYPIEGKWPEHDPDKKRKDKKYPAGQPFDRVTVQDFREGEVIPEEQLIPPADWEAKVKERGRERMREAAGPPGRRQRP
jgi:hypothetical protein